MAAAAFVEAATDYVVVAVPAIVAAAERVHRDDLSRPGGTAGTTLEGGE